MNEKINQVIEEKFTRCPECRSFSVRQTRDLTIKDKIRSLFKSVTVHMCDNCSYRFIVYGKLLTGSLFGKYLVIFAPIVVLAIVTVFLLFAGGKEKEPGTPEIEKKPVTKIEERQTKEIKEQDPPPPRETFPGKEDEKLKPGQKPGVSVDTVITGEIVLENSNRFGVNWRSIGEGVQITRLSSGVLKRAGLIVGDILVEVDGKKIIGEGLDLEIARDEVFYGKRTEVMIKVRRGKETLIFKLVKRKKR